MGQGSSGKFVPFFWKKLCPKKQLLKGKTIVSSRETVLSQMFPPDCEGDMPGSGPHAPENTRPAPGCSPSCHPRRRHFNNVCASNQQDIPFGGEQLRPLQSPTALRGAKVNTKVTWTPGTVTSGGQLGKSSLLQFCCQCQNEKQNCKLKNF